MLPPALLQAFAFLISNKHKKHSAVAYKIDSVSGGSMSEKRVAPESC